MEAIILAGGFGTRLKSVIKDIPKPMAPIVNRPFLEYLLEYLNQQSINRVILALGYKWEIIKDYFGYRYKNIEIIYNIEHIKLGTGGAIKDSLKFTNNEEIYILNGDTFFDIDLSKLKLDDNLITIALKYMKEFDRYGIIELENRYIKMFKEKRYYKEGFINGGIYLINRNIFKNFNKDKFSFEEFLEKNFKNLKAKGEIFDNYFIDIGIPQDYEKAKRYFNDKSTIFR